MMVTFVLKCAVCVVMQISLPACDVVAGKCDLISLSPYSIGYVARVMYNWIGQGDDESELWYCISLTAHHLVGHGCDELQSSATGPDHPCQVVGTSVAVCNFLVLPQSHHDTVVVGVRFETPMDDVLWKQW